MCKSGEQKMPPTPSPFGKQNKHKSNFNCFNVNKNIVDIKQLQHKKNYP